MRRACAGGTRFPMRGLAMCIEGGIGVPACAGIRRRNAPVEDGHGANVHPDDKRMTDARSTAS
ncbi:hypothetical protein WS62_11515 [Burkholderia sp. ABCPW 14]|nr:hypothetical protein WS62_11515 [Burkholderia sp. ABCPW 14]